ncbi:MAG: hypothetical protein BIP78_1252 [Candidatus Bipolaricaulis sibiricus]|uniref:Uncharacterized protein n=1 Tax=Bipolaricaulis sibiricus TaxID=2501609 RepID=A0A410FVP1_BIPS1|nr:MAG: hypothetical protein BIP78_1252 [Candidatus Bipolaricaulis sibiricus]
MLVPGSAPPPAPPGPVHCSPRRKGERLAGSVRSEICTADKEER